MSDSSRQPLLRNDPLSPIPPYNPASAPPAYDHHTHTNNTSASYHSQPVPLPIAQQHQHSVISTTTPYPPCINNQPHSIRTDLTLSGVLCGILLFPIGLACMLTWLQRRCTKCGMRFQ